MANNLADYGDPWHIQFSRGVAPIPLGRFYPFIGYGQTANEETRNSELRVDFLSAPYNAFLSGSVFLISSQEMLLRRFFLESSGVLHLIHGHFFQNWDPSYRLRSLGSKFNFPGELYLFLLGILPLDNNDLPDWVRPINMQDLSRRNGRTIYTSSRTPGTACGRELASGRLWTDPHFSGREVDFGNKYRKTLRTRMPENKDWKK